MNHSCESKSKCSTACNHICNLTLERMTLLNQFFLVNQSVTGEVQLSNESLLLVNQTQLCQTF